MKHIPYRHRVRIPFCARRSALRCYACCHIPYRHRCCNTALVCNTRGFEPPFPPPYRHRCCNTALVCDTRGFESLFVRVVPRLDSIHVVTYRTGTGVVRAGRGSFQVVFYIYTANSSTTPTVTTIYSRRMESANLDTSILCKQVLVLFVLWGSKR